MADFETALVSRIFSVFSFCTQHHQMICTMDFDTCFGILIFEPFHDFARAIASLCMVADFQNALISRIFSVFWITFLRRTTLNDL